VSADLPGLEEKDFDIHLERNVLTVRGEKRAEHDEKHHGWHCAERSYGSFERRIPLPCEVEADKASAEYKQGVLRLTLPKSPEAQRRRVSIPVRAG
jgi:HSP20 family protein